MTRNRIGTVFAALTLSCIGGDPSAEPGEPISIGRSHTIESKILKQTRRINVYLPSGYAEGGERYPALYLLDGGVGEDFVHIAGIASLAADFRRIRPFVVIGIEGIDRYHDLIHPTSVDEEKERLPTAGGAAAFRRFLAEELVPWSRSHLRLTDETVLMGESAAGLFVTETLLRTPELFGGYVAVSPMLWWNGQSLSRAAAELLTTESFPAERRLFLTIADERGPMREGVDRLVGALEAHAPEGLEWTFAPMEHETHGTIFHPAALRAVRTLFVTAD